MSRGGCNPVERTVFHPLVEQWLQSRSLEYQHEPCLGYLYPDFVAYPDDETVMFIECKNCIQSVDSALSAMRQVVRYGQKCVSDFTKRPKYIRRALAAEFNSESAAFVRSFGIEVIHIPLKLINWDAWHRREVLKIEPGDLIVRVKEST